MDDGTLNSLLSALAQSPDNVPLFKLVLEGSLARGDVREALRLISERPASAFSGGPLELLAARVCLRGGAPERALEILTSSGAEVLLERARALQALGRLEEGAEAYRSALAANPTLEDLDLRAALNAKVREIATAGGPKLRVIANDDTADEEVDRILEPEAETISFADVGGLSDVKQQIHKRIILPFQKPSLFQRFKKRVGGGILLYGPPGCGKTMLARATAGECKAAFFSVAISDVLDMYIGESERKLHALFEKARQSKPAVLFFDELEALAGKRQYSREGTSAKLVSQFLSEMDGFSRNNEGVLVLGATNVPWAVDSAFRRPGRFDRVLFVPPPDQEAREGILALLMKDRPHGELDLRAIAKSTSGFSGADLQNLVETAADEAIARSLASGNETPIETADLRSALDEVKPTALEWLTTARNYARYANESGQYDEVLEFLKQHGKA